MAKKDKKEKTPDYPKWTPLFVITKEEEQKIRLFGETFKDAATGMVTAYLDLANRAIKTGANSTTIDYHLTSMQRIHESFAMLANAQAHFEKLGKEVKAAEDKQAKKAAKSGPGAPQG